MSRDWKAVIVDDERLARNKLRSLLAQHPEIQIVGEADGVKVALRVIEETKPDVVFLDIQMPGQSGFDLVNQLRQPIRIIFATAFDEYAIRAFEVNALDYLLKPVNPERLARAVERLSLAAPEPDKSTRPLEYDDYLFLTFGDSSRFLRVGAIRSISAAGVYTEVVTADSQKTLVLKSLNEWEARLPGKYFLRIHRSTIINLEFVERVEKWFNYSQHVYLRGVGEPFVMSRRYAARLREKTI
ncbi:MAG TPA: LytTR family DNA-binding domain-containing protein [Blastocatellia bacterium]|nr:LytTR family DNA-binding domain-containing protein [Blastocatellia bacterium]